MPTLPTSQVRIGLRLLGECSVVKPDARLHVLERHDAALLALLALDGPQARAPLAALLWPDSSPAQALSNLRQRLYRLRRDSGQTLVVGTAVLRLADEVQHDLVAADCVGADRDFGLLTAYPYSEDDELGERVTALRVLWNAARSHALALEADRLEAAADWDGALQMAHRLLAGDAASELAHRRCMRLHYLRGDRAQALAAYARCVHALRLAVDADPGEETRNLAALIESSAIAPAGAQRQAQANDGVLKTGLLRPPRLVGRGLEWAQMRAAWSAGSMLLIEGEAGIGKTRLASEFVQAQGPAVTVKAFANERAAPYALLARLLVLVHTHWPRPPDWAMAELARLVPQWGAAPSQAAEPLRLRQAVAAAFAPWGAAASPSLFIDDVQWADDASLEALLHWLTAQPAARPPVVLCARGGQLPALLESWWAARDSALPVVRLLLAPLDLQGIQALLKSVGAVRAKDVSLVDAASVLLQQTAGHPFLLLELLRSTPRPWDAGKTGAADGPELTRLMAMIQDRLMALPAQALALLRVAALSHADFSIGLASAVMAQPELELVDIWNQLVKAHMLQADGVLIDLVREAALQQIPPAVAKSLHKKVALFLQGHGGRAESTAAHWQHGGEWGLAASSFELAARAAQNKGRTVEALMWWDAAANCHARAADDEALWQARCHGLALSLTSEPADARVARLEAMVPLASSDRRLLHLLLARARSQTDEGEVGPALEDARQASALALALGDEDSELAAAGWCGLALAMAGQLTEGLALFRRYVDRAETAVSTALRLDFFGAQGYSLHLAGAYMQALDSLNIAAEAAEAIGSLGEAAEQRLNVSVCLNTLGRRQESLQQGQLALDLWRRQGEPASGFMTLTQLAPNFYGNGKFAQALDMLERAVSHFRRHGPSMWRVIAEHRLAHVYLRLGQPRLARQCLTPLPSDGDPGRVVARLGIEVRIEHLAGRPALHLLRPAVSTYGDVLTPMDRQVLQLLYAAHLPPREALGLCQDLLRETAWSAAPPVTVHAHARAADAFRRAGDRSGAATHAAAAWELAQQSPAFDISHSELCWLVYQAADAGGDGTTARAALASGVGWIESALPAVPREYLQSFCETNPIHRSLLAEGKTQGLVDGLAVNAA